MHLNWHNITLDEFRTLSKWNFTAWQTVNELAKLNDVKSLGFLTFGRRRSQKTSSGYIRQRDWVWMRYLVSEYFTRGRPLIRDTNAQRSLLLLSGTDTWGSFKSQHTAECWQRTPTALVSQTWHRQINRKQVSFMMELDMTSEEQNASGKSSAFTFTRVLILKVQHVKILVWNLQQHVKKQHVSLIVKDVCIVLQRYLLKLFYYFSNQILWWFS